MGDLTCSLQPPGMRLPTRGQTGFPEYGGNAMMKWANGEKIGPVNGEAIRRQERASRAIRNTSPHRFQHVLFAPACCTARFLIHFRPPKKMIYINKSKASSTRMTGQLLCSLHLVAHSVGKTCPRPERRLGHDRGTDRNRRDSSPLSPISYLFLSPSGKLSQQLLRVLAEEEKARVPPCAGYLEYCL
jgi:hypothetical protein